MKKYNTRSNCIYLVYWVFHKFYLLCLQNLDLNIQIVHQNFLAIDLIDTKTQNTHLSKFLNRLVINPLLVLFCLF